jgi:hypothetical protein
MANLLYQWALAGPVRQVSDDVRGLVLP